MRTMMIDHVATRRSMFPVAAMPDLPFQVEGALAPLPALTRRSSALPGAGLPIPSVLPPGRLTAPLLEKARLSTLPAMTMSATRIAGERLPMFEAMGHRFTVANLKGMAGLSASDRLIRVDASGQGMALQDDDVIDLMDECDLRVVRRSWAS
jgi:hypothetical protein